MDTSVSLNSVLSAVNFGIAQLRANLWHVFLFIVALYFLKHQFKRLKFYSSGTTLRNSRSSISDRTKPHRSNREEQMHQARLRQQEMYNERAKEILEQRRLSITVKMDGSGQSNEIDPTKKSIPKKPTKQSSTNAKTSTTGGYNPMQPWTSSAGGGGYRPSRRTTSRGG